jgi:hypothetical protein
VSILQSFTKHAAAVAALMIGFTSAASVRAAVIAYYPLDTDSNDYSGNGINLSADGSSGALIQFNGIQSMFGGGAAHWNTVANNASNRSLSTADSRLANTAFTNFTGSIWAFADPASNANGWNGGGSDRFLFGSRENANTVQPNGWAIFHNKDVPNNIRLLNNNQGPTSAAVSTIGNTFGADVNSVFHHIATTFDSGTNQIKIYIDGILSVSGNNTSPYTTLTTDGTGKNFAIGNEGDNRSANSAKSWSGWLDDALFLDSTANDAQIAVIHGAGRLASGNAGALNATFTDTQINDVYNAYVGHSSAVAGGVTWRYSANLGHETQIGRIGGSLGGGDAYIVLGTDGSGVTIKVTAHPGDFDSDGDVDGADFVAWQTHFPTPTGATLADGDADSDGDVDGADFVVWQTNFPFTPSPGATPIPEPESWILIVFGASLAIVSTRYVTLKRASLSTNYAHTFSSQERP